MSAGPSRDGTHIARVPFSEPVLCFWRHLRTYDPRACGFQPAGNCTPSPLRAPVSVNWPTVNQKLEFKSSFWNLMLDLYNDW